MVQLVITGKTKGKIVGAITEMREDMGRRVDFGLPMENEYGLWVCYGYQLTVDEFNNCERLGSFPVMDFFGKTELL